MNRSELRDIISDMLEQISPQQMLNEIFQGMNTDELKMHVKYLDQYLFDNHYLNKNDE